MRRQVWSKIILSILVVAILLGSSGCAASGQASKGVRDIMDQLSNLPHRVGQGISSIISSIANVGSALVESIKDTVGGMFGR